MAANSKARVILFSLFATLTVGNLSEGMASPLQCQNVFQITDEKFLESKVDEIQYLQKLALKVSKGQDFVYLLYRLSRTFLSSEQIASDFLSLTDFARTNRISLEELTNISRELNKYLKPTPEDILQVLKHQSATLYFLVHRDAKNEANKESKTEAQSEIKYTQDYVGFKVDPNSSLWTVELPTIKVRNQGSTGSCWLHSMIESLEIRLAKKIGKPVPLSIEYAYRMSLLMRTAIAVRNKNYPLAEVTDLSDGLYEQAALNVLLQYGLVPESVYRAKSSVLENASRNLNLVSEFVWDERMNPEYQKLDDVSALALAEKRFEKKLVAAGMGRQIKNFKFEGQSFTPKSFVEHYFPELKQVGIHTLQLPNIKDAYASSAALESKFDQLENLSRASLHSDIKQIVKASSPQQALEAVRYLIDQGEAVYVVIRTFENQDLYYSPVMPQTQSKNSHAMLVTGYFVDAKNQIQMLKVQNSWGPRFGDKGFLNLPTSYFLQNTLWLSSFGY